MTNHDRVMDLMSTSAGQEKFLAWSTDGITMLMLGAARELARPRGEKTDSSGALYELGASVRANELVDFLTLPASGRKHVNSRLPQPLYGADKIIQEMNNE